MKNSSHGPQINNTKYNFSSRDCLGIESVAASISGELCPIVNTVTPRAFYWPFMVWIYYDFYKNSGITDHTVTTFDKMFLKPQDYFFVLANIINNNPDQRNLVGKMITAQNYEDNKEGPYEFDPNYFKTRYGGMQYYNAGCLTMHFITMIDDKSDKPFTFPKLTQFGEEMAIAFEDVIKDTEYYKNYRLKLSSVPKKALEEYGRVINLSMTRFDRCKALLRHHLFEIKQPENRRLKQSAKYLQFINKEYGVESMNYQEARQILFDYFSPRGMKRAFPEELQPTIVGWEMVVGRQYLTCGIEMIWKYMLELLTDPVTLEEWFDIVVSSSSINDIRNIPLRRLLNHSDLSNADRESLIADSRRNRSPERMVENGLKVALSVYHRFKDRDDLGDVGVLLDYGKGKYPGTGSLSFNEWISMVDEYLEEPVELFLKHTMKSCIVDQHKRTCYDKLMRSSQSINGFYFECIDDMYMGNEHKFQVDFQGIRLIQLMQVMKDLDMFEEGA